jgi:hypothetical protein
MRLFELGGMLHTEMLPVPRTNIDCLDEARLANYIKDILRDSDVPIDQQFPLKFLLPSNRSCLVLCLSVSSRYVCAPG